jgi:hypothetical protein
MIFAPDNAGERGKFGFICRIATGNVLEQLEADFDEIIVTEVVPEILADYLG